MSVFALETDKRWTTGYISGIFDGFHIGHLNLIRRAKERCDRLVVGVLSDDAVMQIKHEPPTVKLQDRIAIIEALKYVDEVDVTSPVLLNKVAAWHRYKFDAMFSGDDHLHDAGWTWEEELLNNLGAELVFFSYTEGVDA
ncbi:MAG: adenylyltransferase/cytidyltransferase family protein [Coriobacteriales bacterium]|nr:adenylyltransferase/cytidyltransferase family protein [Coriobacteriales bacterium]